MNDKPHVLANGFDRLGAPPDPLAAHKALAALKAQADLANGRPSFAFPGDHKFLLDAIAAHGGDFPGITPGDVRTCKALGMVTHFVATAAERRDPAEALVILANARKHLAVLAVAHEAAGAILDSALTSLGRGAPKLPPALGDTLPRETPEPAPEPAPEPEAPK